MREERAAHQRWSPPDAPIVRRWRTPRGVRGQCPSALGALARLMQTCVFRYSLGKCALWMHALHLSSTSRRNSGLSSPCGALRQDKAVGGPRGTCRSTLHTACTSRASPHVLVTRGWVSPARASDILWRRGRCVVPRAGLRLVLGDLGRVTTCDSGRLWASWALVARR